MTLIMWWPSSKALENLTVEDAEHGFTLSAPDHTECGEWLAYWNQSKDHQKVFSDSFSQMLKDHLDFLETKNGKTETVPDQ